MKILGIILAFLMLAGSAFLGVTGSNKARDAAKSISSLTDGMSSDEKAMLEKTADEAIPSSGRLSTGGIVAIVAAIAAFGLLVVTFAKKSLVPALAVATVGLTAVSAAIYPHIKPGPLDGWAPRTQALIATVLALIGALGAALAARKTAA